MRLLEQMLQETKEPQDNSVHSVIFAVPDDEPHPHIDVGERRRLERDTAVQMEPLVEPLPRSDAEGAVHRARARMLVRRRPGRPCGDTPGNGIPLPPGRLARAGGAMLWQTMSRDHPKPGRQGLNGSSPRLHASPSAGCGVRPKGRFVSLDPVDRQWQVKFAVNVFAIRSDAPTRRLTVQVLTTPRPHHLFFSDCFMLI
jgi:hypothetical protein